MRTYCNKIITLAAVLFLSFQVAAQDLGSITTEWQQGNLAWAKEAIDEFLIDSAENVEGWLLKGRIYNSISNDAALKDLTANSRMTAFKSVTRAAELNKELVRTELAKDDFKLVYNIYNGYTSDGIAFFNAGTEKNNKEDYAVALTNFKKAGQVNDFLFYNYWGGNLPDFSNLYYSCLSAIYAGKQFEAYRDAVEITDREVAFVAPDKGFQPIYEWLAFYLKQQGNEYKLQLLTKTAVKLFTNASYFYLNYIDLLREKKEYERMVEWYGNLMYRFPAETKYALGYYNELFRITYHEPDSITKRKEWKVIYISLEYGLEQFVEKNPANAAARLLLAKAYVNKAAEIKKQNKVSSAKKLEMRKQIKLSNIQLKFISDKLPETDKAVYNEAVKLLVSNLTVLNEEEQVRKYKQKLIP